MAAESDICDGNLEISTKNGRSGGTPREKFEAAVNVIQGLPKNGSFQPSHEMMLRFYGYYKQATLGPCSIPQPWAWDVVGRAKWNAWSAMGEMPREEAMLLYVNELKQVLPKDRSEAVGKIIETMPQTDQVAEFIEKLGSFYEIVDERDEPVRSSGRKPAFEGIEKLMARAEIHLNGNGVGSESDSEEDSDKDVDTMEVRETIEHHRVLVTENYASQDSGIGLSESPPKEIHYLPNPEADYNANSKKPRPDRPAHSAHRTNGNHHHQQHYQQQQQQQRSLPTISSDTDSEAEFCDSTDHLGQSTLPTAVGQSGASNGPMSDAIAQRGGGETPDGRSDGRAVDGTRSSSRRGPQNRPTPEQTYLGTPPSLPVGAVGGAAGGEFPGRGGVPTTAHMDPQIAATLLRLQHDMNHILMKLNTLETHVLEQRRNDQAVQRPRTPSWCRWWPFGNLPAKTVVAILAWPVFLQLIFRLFRLVQRRRRKLPR